MEGSISIKTPADIKSIRHAAGILREALDVLEAAAKPGVSTQDLDTVFNEFVAKYPGAKPGFKGYMGFPGSICTSINERVVHGIPRQDEKLKDGDIIGIDAGVWFEGFHTDAARTVMVGNVTPEVRHFVKTTQEALKRACKVVKPGAKVGDISAVIQKTLEDQGYSPVIECTGHGVGRNLHEPPEIMNVGKKGTGPTLKAGMVLAIEPIACMGTGDIETLKDGWTIVSSDGTLSAHFEHTVLVTEKGYEILA
jgi:methionyl aminopeptidase